MRMKLIEMTNYKSFKEKTTVALSRNCNVIVGKNGSGKSNLITAIEAIVCCPRIEVGERQNMIHEGSVASDESCMIEIVFDNSSQRFHGPKSFSIKRTISLTKDEFYVDGRLTLREEVKGMFESAGIPVASPYFMVLQGRINSMAVMNEVQRYNLIKSVAGVSKYEEDRRKSLGMLEETTHTQAKVEGILERITSKLGGLEKDKETLTECETLENEKRRCEMAFTQREIVELNQAIREMECPLVEEGISEESEEVEDLEFQIQEVRKEIERAFKDKGACGVEEDHKMEALEKRLQNISVQLNNSLSRKQKVNEAYESSYLELHALKMLRDYLKTNQKDMEEEKANCRILIEEMERNTKKRPNEGNTNILYDMDSLKGLVEKRNELWREEKCLKGDLKGVEDNLVAIGNKLVLSGRDLHKELAKEEGVLGCVLDLYDVPEDLITAFEAVAGPHLFSVVVEDETVASRLSFTGVTYIPLNRMFYKDPPSGIENENLFLLSSKIKCEDRFKSLLGYITKNVFVSSDIKTSNFYSKKYFINVVTLDGDFFNSSGVIMGGYEGKKKILVEYKRLKKIKEETEKRLKGIKAQISQITFKIDSYEIPRFEGFLKVDHAKVLERFTREKLAYLTSPFKYEDKIKNLELKLSTIEGEQESLSSTINKLNERLAKYKKHFLDSQSRREEGGFEDKRLQYLQEKERELVRKLKKKEIIKLETVEDIEKEKERAKRHLLYNKRLELMKKIGLENHKEMDLIYPALSKEELTNRLKEIQHSLKKYVMINRKALHQWNTFIEQKNALKSRLDELKSNLENIRAFIEDLDGKKERFLEFTFEMFRNNFKYFSGRLCSFGELDLLKEDERLAVTLKGEELDLNILSGGQKTMMALCFIFSIQKIDPSPFYVFDEADANLDKQSREKITELFRETVQEEDVQLVISTFKEELVNCGNKFIGVSFSDKKSYLGEVTKEVVSEFLTE